MSRPAVNVNFHHLADLLGVGRADVLAVLRSSKAVDRNLLDAAGELERVTLNRDHLVAVGHKHGALLQSFLAARTIGDPRSYIDSNGLLQPRFSARDGVILSNFSAWSAREVVPLPLVGPAKNMVSIPDHVAIALFGDWATGTSASTRVAEAIGVSGCGIRVHLGDVYYSGTHDETVGYLLEEWPERCGTIDRACNSNHEMYSGGGSYVNLTLRALGQASSYFVLQNRFWNVIGLDTGLVDGRVSSAQVDDTIQLIEQSGDRRVILLSHHPLYYWEIGPNKEMLDDVMPLLSSGRVAAWYWAHEHAYVRFEVDRYGVFATCVGHGGFPYLNLLSESEVAASSGNFRLNHLRHAAGIPASVGLLGPSEMGCNPDAYGPMGWLRITLDGPTIVERVVDLDGIARFERQLDRR